MPRSKHRRKPGTKSRPHPGRGSVWAEIHRGPMHPDGRPVDADSVDEWLAGVQGELARNPPKDITPEIILAVAKAWVGRDPLL
jgi:hypothetical protein